jgi:hypothetical protein
MTLTNISRRSVLILIPTTALGLTACATSTSISDGTQLHDNQGLLAFRVQSDLPASMQFDLYDSSRANAVLKDTLFGRLASKGVISFEKGSTTLLIPVDPGEYMWTKFRSGNKYVQLASSNRFSVKRATVTYIGDLVIQIDGMKFAIVATDRETEMKEHVTKNFPQYTAALPFEKAITDFRASTVAK